MAKQQDTKVSSADFIKSLKSKKKALAAAAKVKAGGGLVEDSDIIAKYDLSKDNTVVLNGKVSKVTYGWAKGDKNRPYVSFFYMVNDGTNLPSVYREFSDDRGMARAFGEFQRLGYDTTEWDDDPATHIVEAAEEITKKNPSVSLKLGVWGEDEDRLNIGVTLVKGKASKPADDVEDDDDDDDDDSEEAEYDADDPSTWVDYECEFKIGKKTYTGVITAYDEDDESFTVTDEDEEEHQVAATKVKLLTE